MCARYQQNVAKVRGGLSISRTLQLHKAAIYGIYPLIFKMLLNEEFKNSFDF